MRTTLNLDDEVLQAAMKLSEGRTKNRSRERGAPPIRQGEGRRRLLELRGKVIWEGTIDNLRKRR